MKHLKFAFLTFFLFYISGVKAQQNHFIYIQTENGQPFYVKLEKKIYSSTGAGYLVLSKLKEGTYNLAIGFPKSEWSEQNAVCTIENNDVGYLLKNFESKGWGLFNLQTMAITMASDSGKVANMQVINKTDAFSNMLSTVVNDSTIRQTEVVKQVKKEVPKESDTALIALSGFNNTAQDQAANEVSKDESNVNAGMVKAVPATAREGEKTELVKKPVTLRSAITRNLFNSNAAGTEMVFIDESNGKKDTVRVFIPAEENAVATIGDKPIAVRKPADEPRAEPLKREANKPVEYKPAENKFSGNQVAENKNKGNIQTGKPVQQPVEPVIQKAPMINSDCKSQASDDDFLKLRKKMAAEDNDDDMIRMAKKIFKSKCFTVEQVKNLSVLFLKDSGKYSFFDLAYPFVSDSHNYGTLQGQLSDVYYINRFQSMIRH